MVSLTYCECSWRIGHERHHDVLLRVLKRMEWNDYLCLYDQVEFEGHSPLVPADKIAMIDLADFAIDHGDVLMTEIVQLAKTLSQRARQVDAPEMGLVALR